MTDTFREESRRNWHQTGDGPLSDDRIKIGCLQRIADATELMAKDHARLVREAEWLKRRAENAEATATRLARSNAALRGVIRKLKQATP